MTPFSQKVLIVLAVVLGAVVLAWGAYLYGYHAAASTPTASSSAYLINIATSSARQIIDRGDLFSIRNPDGTGTAVGVITKLEDGKKITLTYSAKSQSAVFVTNSTSAYYIYYTNDSRQLQKGGTFADLALGQKLQIGFAPDLGGIFQALIVVREK